CGHCAPMLRMIDRTIGARAVDWYHVSYRGDFADGRWPLAGRAPRAILVDPRCAAADAFAVHVTPGLILIDADGMVIARAAGSEACRALADALRRVDGRRES